MRLLFGTSLVVICVFLLNAQPIYAQDPTHFFIGEDQFANTDIYTLLYDDTEEVLYVGTNDGLFIYRQNRFIRFAALEGQMGNSFFDLKMNSRREIFCANLNGQVFKIIDGKLELFYSLDLDDGFKLFNYFIDGEDRIIVVSKYEIRSIDVNGHVEILFDLTKLKNGEIEAIEAVEFEYFICRQTSDGCLYLSYNNKKTVLKIKDLKLEVVEISSSGDYTDRADYFDIDSKVFGILDEQNRIVNVEESIQLGTKLRFKERFFSLTKSELIGLDVKGGARILALRNDTLIEQQSMFSSEFIAAVISNQNGTLFLGTFGKGIIVIPDKKVIQHHLNSLLLGIETTPENDVYLSTREGEIYKFDTEIHLIDKIKANVDDVFYVPSNFKFENIQEENIIYETYSSYYVGIKDVCLIDENNVIISGLNGIYFLSKEKGSLRVNVNYLDSRGRSASVVWSPEDQLIYFTTNRGVTFCRADHTSADSNEYLSYRGRKFIANDLVHSNDRLYCATSEFGVLIYQDNKLVDRISIKNGLKSTNIKSLMVDGNVLYLISTAGLQCYNFMKGQFIHLGIAEGVIPENITDFALSNDKLWLLEKHNFYSIDISSPIKEKMISRLYIDSLQVNDVLVNYKNCFEFAHNENKIKFFFDYRHIESKSETTILYTLDGFYDDWKSIETSENVIEFQSLPVGNYTFKMKAQYRGQETEVFEYNFTISPPYWLTWWFYSIIGLILIGLAFIIFRYRMSVIQKKNRELLEKQELRTNVLDSELKALRSQMNPHFIFNSLNSIQGLILEQNTDASYDYIVLFANLVRSALNYSNQDFIPMQKELEFLDVYLKLEKLRFGDEFTYTIQSDIDQEIEVPSLIVQPFIENALVHGLMHKKGKRTISINFELKDTLRCIIIDNGIGRMKAQEIQERQGREHESFALQAIESRLKILSAKEGLHAEFITTDLHENGIPSGTMIELVMPYRDSF